MKIVIPMAGIGKRLRPFTLTTPKPLLKIAGKTIVQRLVEKIISVTSEKVTEVGFIIGDFTQSVVDDLHELGEQLKFKVNIYVQNEALGTAHAIYFAEEMLKGEVIVAFADTLFDAKFKLRDDSDVVIWTKKVDNAEAYGVVVKGINDSIIAFHEKPKEFISDEAIIGIYYFKNGEVLSSKLNTILKDNIIVNGEYQLTDALQMMLDDGKVFTSQTVDTWLDCGNKKLLLNTATYVLHNFNVKSSPNNCVKNSVLVEPVYIGANVKITNSVIGPNVVVEDDSCINSCIISNSIILENAKIDNSNFKNSMLGNNSRLETVSKTFDLGDYDKLKI